MIILSMFEGLMILMIVHSLMKDLKTKIIYKIIYIVAMATLIATCNTYIESDVFLHLISTSIACIFLYSYVRMSGNRELSVYIVLFLVVLLTVFIIQFLGVVILNRVIGEVKYTFIDGLMAQSISLIILVILRKVVPFATIYTFIEDKNKLFRIIIFMLFIIYYGVSIIWFIDISYINESIIWIIMMILFAILINLVILKEGLLNRSYIEKIRIYDTYLPIIDHMVDEFRSCQHDYHNHIQTILAMKKNDLAANDELESYVHELYNENIWNDLFIIENKVVLAFFYSKYLEAMGEGINLTFDANQNALSSVYENHELVEMYGILIDNALEAVKTKDSDRSVAIKLYKENTMNIFEVRNSYDYISVSQINTFFKKGYTTKDKKPRGIGLYKLKNMIEKKKGTISFYYDTLKGQVVARIDYF